MPSSTVTSKTVLAELDMMARRIKEGRTSDDLRRLLNLMNDLRLRLPDEALVVARYSFLRAVLYIKGARTSGSWVSSSGESLYYALDLLEFTSDALKEHMMRHPRVLLEQFQQDCAYEAMVAVTTLRTWGRNLPEQLPDTGCLPSALQRKIANHLSHGYPLRSRFA